MWDEILDFAVDAVAGGAIVFLLTFTASLAVWAVPRIWRELTRPQGECDGWGFDD